MNVVIVSDARAWGGLEVHTTGLVDALLSSGHSVILACIGDRAYDLYRAQLRAPVKIVDLGLPVRRTVIRWYRALASIDADAAILQKGTLHTGGFALDVALRLKFRRLVAVQHLEPPVLPAKVSRRYVKGVFPGIGLWWYRARLSGYVRCLCPQITVCVSDSVRLALAASYGFPRGKLVTIRNGVDLERFRPDVRTRLDVRSNWGVPVDAFVFGSVRRFEKEKGLDVAIEAFAALSPQVSAANARLVLIGEGPEQEALAALAERLGVAPLTIFPGFTAAAWRAYAGFDVFLIPSRIEALGVVVLEAMASHCLVIGSRVGGIPEMLSDSSLGVLVPPGDSTALAQAMRQTMTINDEERSRMAGDGRRHVGKHFEVHAQCMKIVALLK
jgi:glycosyltransferase involved in cell wall biosynthesis